MLRPHKKSGAQASGTLEAVFHQRGWLATQPEAFRLAVLGQATPVEVRAGEPLWHEDDDPGGILGIVRGGVGVLVSNTRHGPVLATIQRDGEWLGAGPMLIGGRRSLGYRALDDCVLMLLPLPRIRAIEAADPGAARCFGALGLIASNLAARVVADLLIPMADRRIAATLLRVLCAEEAIAPPTPAGFRLTQSEIGEMANASRNYVNQTLRKFAAHGWVALSYRAIALTNPAALHCFAVGEATG